MTNLATGDTRPTGTYSTSESHYPAPLVLSLTVCHSPAAVFPVTTVDPLKDPKDVEYVPKNDQDKLVYDMYTPEKFAGMPINLQVVGRRQYDEKVLAALEEIEHAMGRK